MRIVIASVAMAVMALTASSQGTARNGMKKGEWKRRHVPDGYHVQKIGKYQVQSDCEEVVSARVANHLNAMFQVYRKFSPSKKTPRGNLVVKLFQDRKGFLGYGAPPSAAGYYSKRDREMVGYHTGKVGGVRTVGAATGEGRRRRRGSMDTLGVFSHEGWHQYFHWSCGSEVPFPAWLDEGIGDYFYTAWLKGKKAVIGAPMDGRLVTIRRAVEKGRYVPLGEFVRYTQREYYSGNRGQNYAQGWSVVHFFMEHPEYKKRRIPQRFVKIFQDEHAIAKTIPQVFGKKVDWEAIEKDWKEWVLAMPVDLEAMDDPVMVALARPGNEKARVAMAALEPAVRKAIEDCLTRRQSAAK